MPQDQQHCCFYQILCQSTPSSFWVNYSDLSRGHPSEGTSSFANLLNHLSFIHISTISGLMRIVMSIHVHLGWPFSLLNDEHMVATRVPGRWAPTGCVGFVRIVGITSSTVLTTPWLMKWPDPGKRCIATKQRSIFVGQVVVGEDWYPLISPQASLSWFDVHKTTWLFPLGRS